MQIIFTILLLMEQIILIFKFFFIVIILIFLNNYALSQSSIIGKAEVIDGDTIHINNNKIRLHGIDAPEIKQTCMTNDVIWNCGIKSKKTLQNFILEKEVNCKIVDIDRYKRFVGICFANNKNINSFMVKNGWAIAYKYYSNLYVDDERWAIKNKLGIWKSIFIEPYQYRKL